MTDALQCPTPLERFQASTLTLGVDQLVNQFRYTRQIDRRRRILGDRLGFRHVVNQDSSLCLNGSHQ
jgi:hypothetical protein